MIRAADRATLRAPIARNAFMKTSTSGWPLRRRAGLLARAGVVAAARRAGAGRAPPRSSPPPDVATPKYGAWGFDETGRDTDRPARARTSSATPTATWYDREQIPADRTRYGNFDKLIELSENRTRLLIEQAAAGNSDATPTRPRSATPTRPSWTRRGSTQLDAQPLQPDLAAIRGEQTNGGRRRARWAVRRSASRAPSSTWASTPTPRTRTATPSTWTSAGLGLPDRDYYLKPEFADKKSGLPGLCRRDAEGDRLARSGRQRRRPSSTSRPSSPRSAGRARTERDPTKTYNPTPVAGAGDLCAGLRLQDLPGRAPNSARATPSCCDANTAFPKTAAIFAATPLDTLKAWQAFHLVDAAAPYLSDRFVEARFDFRNKILAGQPEIQPRWKRAVDFVNGTLGEAVGRLYVAQYFTPEAKAKMDALVGNLQRGAAAPASRRSTG